MGNWHTLHLFNDKIFYQDLVPKFKNHKYNLRQEYLEYMKHNTTGGINQYEVEELNRIIDNSIRDIRFHTDKMNEEFKVHSEYNFIEGYKNKRKYLSNYPIVYSLGCFMEFMIFSKCADFYPQKTLGKAGLRVEASKNSVADEILVNINFYDSIFIADDYSGIFGWITNEEVELLYYSKNQLINHDAGFINLLDKAFEYKLGLVIGVNMHEGVLKRLDSFKLIPIEKWDNSSLEGLCVE
jgi:hypothetical protein